MEQEIDKILAEFFQTYKTTVQTTKQKKMLLLKLTVT